MPGGFSGKFSETTGAKGYRPTNADRIRGMGDEELAEFIQSPFCDRIAGRCGGACHDCTLDWLRQPAEEAHDGQII